MSRFTAKVGKSIDIVQTFDEYAARALEDIAERQQNPSTLPSRVISAISLLAAFSLKNTDYYEEQVKRLFISTVDQIRGKVRLLIDDSFELAHGLNKVQQPLDRIKVLAINEIGDLPRMDALAALWTRLAPPDGYEQFKSHGSLLTDMTKFYEKSSYVMKETTAALNHVEAELSEFRDDFATPALILKNNPLEVLIALFRKSGQRLEVGKRKLEYIENTRRSQRSGI